jgi:hypothetical protein
MAITPYSPVMMSASATPIFCGDRSGSPVRSMMPLMAWIIAS